MVLDGKCDGDEDDDEGGIDVLLGGLHINTSATDNEEFTEMFDDDEMDSAHNRTEELPSQMPLIWSLLAKPHHRRGQQCPSGSARTTPTHTSDLQMRFTKIHQSGRRAMTETHLLMAPHLPILQQTTNSSHYQRTSTILAILFGFHISLFIVSCVLLV